eukprot:TRINITY_DN616_c1_g2_i1.p1 TRINITY_DN616_c1_g2~~TRINITY_DN616_c1_g2_i1.p1  ORF type:complete len:1008 (-),score=401.27 TRINITY_DN616_c1_g2_i1:84-3056(-)
MAQPRGVDDLVLLEDISQEGILKTLKQRYDNDLIYTYIGHVLVAVNPYRVIPNLYGKNVVKNYQGRYIYEEAPHVYAIAEDAYRSLLNEGQNQCIIITGESGSGKTETSKLIMQYIAAVTGKATNVQKVKEQILESNPVLEAFGNAKTVQNNNSSRFGKYFEIQFDYSGDPVGGRITNYLLEKSRVVSQAQGERNFHVFYQLIAGANANEKREFHLGSVESYYYLNQSGSFTVDGVNDAAELETTRRAMTVVGISEAEQHSIFKLVAAVLHLGQLKFEKKGEGSTVANKDELKVTSDLLGITTEELEKTLCSKTVTRGTSGAASRNVSMYFSPLKPEQAAYTRDALSKHVYSRLFDYIVVRINENIFDPTSEYNIGVLDIYGFEIFQKNSFEQLCINYVNEKLQQIFIELTLKSEQEEYVKEGIPWEPIKYFNNKPCVELIERRGGIFSLLDEESIFPNASDKTLLDKLNKNCASDKHFQVSDVKQGQNGFTVVHYAGSVNYDVTGFLDKNTDTLFIDLKMMLQQSRDQFLAKLFPPETQSKQRPPTAAIQFKEQVASLVNTLMACHPHYIRCIRPNGVKKPKTFDDALSRNQIQYLGLLENVRVRRAGYAYRQTYDKFLHRFKLLTNETWPKWTGSPKDGSVKIVTHMKIPAASFATGSTKIFIREPRSLFTLEEARSQKLDDILRVIQTTWRTCRGGAFMKKCEGMSAAIFHGKKERQRMSVYRPFKGDYLNLGKSSMALSIKKKFNDSRVYFSDKVSKLDDKGKKLGAKTVLVTNLAIYVVGGLFKKVNARIPFSEIKSISLSTLPDGVFVVHTSSGDHVFEGEKKTEMVTMISELMRDNRNDDHLLQVNFSNTIDYTTKSGAKKLEFQNDEAAQGKCKIRTAGNITYVSIAKALDKSAGGVRYQRFKDPDAGKQRQINRSNPNINKVQGQHQAEATQNYAAKNAREISFNSGDIINVLQKGTGPMWQGECKGRTGTFPASHVKLLN